LSLLLDKRGLSRILKGRPLPESFVPAFPLLFENLADTADL
jgi:hypothetical protein